MTTHVSQTIPLSFTTSEFFQNPYPLYEQVRSIHPIYWGNLLKHPGWYVTGYEEAITILKILHFKIGSRCLRIQKNMSNSKISKMT